MREGNYPADAGIRTISGHTIKVDKGNGGPKLVLLYGTNSGTRPVCYLDSCVARQSLTTQGSSAMCRMLGILGSVSACYRRTEMIGLACVLDTVGTHTSW